MWNTLSDFWSSVNAGYWIGLLSPPLVAFVLGYIANVLSAPHSTWFKQWTTARHLRDLLRLGGEEVIVVVPHQAAPSERRLPQLAIEDVLALRNVFEILA